MTARLLTAALCAAACAAPAAAQPAGRPAGVDAVPTTAFGFVTVKVSDLWDAEAMKPVRETLTKGDPPVVRELEQALGFGPADVERVTAFWPSIPLAPGADAPFVVVTTRKPYNEARVLKALKATLPGSPFGPGRGGIAPKPAFAPKLIEPKAAIPGEGAGPPPGLDLIKPPDVAPFPVPAPGSPPVPKKEPIKKDAPGLVGGADDPPAAKQPVKAGDSSDGPELFYIEGHSYEAVYLLDDHNLLFLPIGPGPVDGTSALTLIGQLLRRKADGPLADALALADKHTAVAAARVGAIVPFVRGVGGFFGPEVVPFQSLLKAQTVALTADVAPNAKMTARLAFADAAAARRAEPVLKTLFQYLGEQVAAARKQVEKDEERAGVLLPVFDLVAKALDKAEVKADGATVFASTEAELGPAVAKAMAGAPTAVRAAADRAQTQNNLKQIALACHNFHDAMGYFPTDIVDPQTGKPILSWRVAVLPYIEQQNLYQAINLNQPWDGPQNKRFAEQMPDVFKVYGRETKGKGLTFLQMPSSDKPLPGGSPFKVAGQKTRIVSISDGTSNTLMIVEAADPVAWMKPDDVQFDPKNLPKLGSPGRGRFQAAFADGSVREFKRAGLTDDVLRALLTTNGGEVVNLPDR